MSVEVGQEAPDFEVRDQNGTPVRLSSFRGEKNVVLVFYPLAFTPTCTGELCAIRDESSVFENDDTVVFGVSCDSPATLKVFAEREGYEFSLLSDFWPHGEVSRAYGVFVEERGFSTRGSFVIDKDGIVRWAVVNGPGEARSADDYAAALAAL